MEVMPGVRAAAGPPGDPFDATPGSWHATARRAVLVRRRATKPGPLRIVLGDDSLLFREGLASILSTVDALEIVAVGATEDEVIQATYRERPDVVVTDIRMPPTHTDEGVRIADRMRKERPEIGVLALSQFVDASWAVRLFQTGSAGRAYMLKQHVARRDQLIDAIREVAGGGSYVDPRVVETLVDAHVRGEQSPLLRLTERQLQVLALVAEGMSNASIATTLVLTKRAVERYVGDIFAKLDLDSDVDVSRRVAATLLYLRETKPPSG